MAPIQRRRRLASAVSRIGCIVSVTVLVLAAIAPFYKAATAYAYGLMGNREIMMSSSAAGNTGTKYTISFKTATAGAIEGMVINFCDNDPILADTCTTTTQSVNNTGVTLSSGSLSGPSDTNTAHWTVSDSGAPNSSTPSIVTLTNAASSTSVATNTQVSFELSGFTNPSYSSCTGGTAPNCTFYGRILTYTTTAGATGYTPTSIGSPSDAGGVALSTAAQITVISKVQEEISFCVYNSTGQTTSCGTTPTINLGNNNGVLSTAGAFVDKNIDYDIQTNASGSAAINMQGTTLQTSGAVNSIAGVNPIAGSSAGTSQFGICTWEESGTGGQLVPDSASGHDYSGLSGSNGALCSDSTISQSSGTATPSGSVTPWFYFNTSNTTGIPSTYGDTIATDAAGPTATGKVAFLGNIAITQAAGIYTATLGLIANGTY